VAEPEPFPTDPSSAYYRYSQSLQQIMLDSQFLEESLRMCLVRVYALIHTKLKGEVAFKLPLKELERDEIGRLICKLEQFINDADLIAALKVVQRARNHYAHRGMLLTTEEQGSVAFLEGETRAIHGTRRIARECLAKLLAEWQRLEEILNQTAGSTP